MLLLLILGIVVPHGVLFRGASEGKTYVLRNEEGDNLFNCGIGGKYRLIRVIYKDGEEDKIDGIGLTFFAGADINLKNDWKIFTELEYDKITGEYDGDEYPVV